MKWLGASEDPAARGPPVRSQDDAAVGYVFQRAPHEPEFPPFGPKQQRWALGDDTALDNHDKWKYPPHMNNTTANANIKTHQVLNHQPVHSHQVTLANHPSALNHSIPNHTLQNHTLPGGHMNQTMLAPGQNPHLMALQAQYDVHGQHLGVNGGPKQPEHLVYLGGQPPLSVLAPQNQYLAGQTRNVIAPSAKKLWDKGVGAAGDCKPPLPPLHLHGPHEQLWRDSTWSTQEHTITQPIMAPRRTFPPAGGDNSILSPRDSTGGLGVKMVEYVLGGSPTAKESPLGALEPRLRSLAIGDGDKQQTEHKDKASSPFDANGLPKKDETVIVVGQNGQVNGIEDDKGFNRTPGSRQPSPAEEEQLHRTGALLEQAHYHPQGLHTMQPGLTLNDSVNQHIEHVLALEQNYETQQGYATHHPPSTLLNGAMVNQTPMINAVQAGESPAALLQQQHNFDVQQLFRSQQPQLAGAASAAPVAGAAAPLQQLQVQQQFLQQGYQQAPYVINAGQEGSPYVGALIAAGVPQYYGVAPWVYPAGLLPQTASAQPRRPLTPSQQPDPQQQAVQGQYQVIPAYYDQSGSLVMGGGVRNGTPMRLVSPAPVLVPPASRPPQPPSALYPTAPVAPATAPSIYTSQNGTPLGGVGTGALFPGLHAPQPFSGGLGTLGSPATQSGLALNTSSLTARRDSFDRNTSAFSPSLEYGARPKWTQSYGAGASASPLPLAPLTPPPPSQGLGALVSNRAPGAEAANKYRQVGVSALAPGLTTGNTIFGSTSSIFSKLAVRPSTGAPLAPLERPPGRSRLLEDFRNQRYPNLQLRELTNHIVEFSQDQHGSRFIQQKLERATVAEKQLVFNEILAAAYNLMTDVFGNYVIQKFFEFGTQDQKSTLAQKVRGHVLPLALQMYGCRVIQKALESIPPEQQQEIVRELDGHVLKCVKDQNGNHVVQKCIECVEPMALQFVINAFSGQVYGLSTHPYGCRVIQRILEHCTSEQTAPILSELHAHTEQLIQDQYGNYVIQHVLEHGKPEDKAVLIAGVRGKVLVLSQHKFASNVVEKCVTHATRAEKALLIEEVCSFNDNSLHVMMKDQYANYVVQKMIDVSEPTQRKVLMHKIRPHLNSLRKYTYGKHIIAKLEKFFMKTASAMSALGGSELGPIGPPTNGVL